MDERFTELERAAISAIAAENPDIETAILSQVAHLQSISRENSGGGFFTEFSVHPEASPVKSQSPIGHEVYAAIEGLQWGIGLMLFLKDGLAYLIEGYAVGPESTKPIDFTTAKFAFSEPGKAFKAP